MNIFRRNDGFTLIEVIAATAVFLIAILAVSALLMQGYRTLGSAGSRSISVHSAQEEIENAIQDPTGEITEEISREEYTIEVFGQEIEGTLITIKKSFPGTPGGEITYTTFVPHGSED